MRYNTSLMGTLTKVKRTTPRQKGRRTKHLFDWMARARNLSKGSPAHRRDDHSRCSFCGSVETQQHINVACSYPPLVELRQAHKRHVDTFFQTYRHQNLPPGQRWIVPVIDYMEDHMWSDTEQGGDIWNGRWPTDLIEELLPFSSSHKTPPEDLKASINWIRRLTLILQHTQRALYGARHLELMSKHAKIRRDRVTALRKRHRTRRTRTLYEAWRIPYFRPLQPRRRPSALPPHRTLPLPLFNTGGLVASIL
jgi:hypothetical protein